MTLRFFLISMTLVAVVSDYLLHPFYPHFFELRFGITDPRQVGLYFSAVCTAVMVAFPFWAYISKKTPELRILVYTQIVAGVLAVSCFYLSSYMLFWVISLVMIVFKGSYLLVYPYILKVSAKKDHTAIIGLLSVIVHFGSILGAILGGAVIDLMDPAYIFLVMASGDFLQAGISLYLLKSARFVTEYDHNEATAGNNLADLMPTGFILKLGLTTFILYFSAFIIRPFFVRYWEAISIYDNTIVSASVYAIPAFVALAALWMLNKKKDNGSSHQRIMPALLLGFVGLILQGYPNHIVVVMGRLVYGWAIFQATVRFDALVFDLSTPSSYSMDYSKVHFFQNLGVLFASFTAGILVDTYGLQAPFIVAMAGFAITTFMYYLIFKAQCTTNQLKEVKN